jgi:uncharacterized protein (DUF488 family)
MPPIRTIGYEGIGFEDFIRTLKASRVRHVLDIRDLPLSRRAGFSKRQLAAGLEEHGLRYSHLKGLGTPKEGRIAAKSGDLEKFRKIFAHHMTTERAQVELQKASEIVKADDCCLLCFEADEKKCHRSTVARALTKITGLSVAHLHASSNGARADEGKLNPEKK